MERSWRGLETILWQYGNVCKKKNLKKEQRNGKVNPSLKIEICEKEVAVVASFLFHDRVQI